MARGNSTSKTLVWILMALLVLGLGGFGITNLSGSIRKIGSVGDRDITVSAYQRAVFDEIRAQEASLGQPIPFTVARALNLDRIALAKLIATTALDSEADRIGISVGDENLREALLAVPQFRGPDGAFNRDAYRFYLDQTRQSETEYERSLRDEMARGLLQQAVLAGVPVSDTYANTLLGYLAERRDFSWAMLTEADLPAPLPEPDEAELAAFHAEHADLFTLPERKRITYDWLSPEMIADQVTIDEADLKKSYDARSDEFNQPERRLVERLVFPDEAAAEAAKVAIEDGSKSFEDIVAARGLNLSDIDLGDVAQSDLGGAGAAVFAAETGQVVGPFQTDLGPALFRVNGVLAAHKTSFEEARPQLREELALGRARRQIDDARDAIDDLLASGATLEEIARESDMQLGHIDWTADSDEGIAAFDAFRKEAAKITADDFPTLIELADGGIAALRLDAVIPAELQPLDAIRDEVAAAWRDAEIARRLRDRAEALRPQVTPTTDMASLGLTVTRESDVTRNDFIPGTTPDFLGKVFAADPGETIVIGAAAAAFIVRIDAVKPPDETSEEVLTARETLTDQARSSETQDLLQYYINDVQSRTGLTLDQNAINAVLAGFQ